MQASQPCRHTPSTLMPTHPRVLPGPTCARFFQLLHIHQLPDRVLSVSRTGTRVYRKVSPLILDLIVPRAMGKRVFLLRRLRHTTLFSTTRSRRRDATDFVCPAVGLFCLFCVRCAFCLLISDLTLHPQCQWQSQWHFCILKCCWTGSIQYNCRKHCLWQCCWRNVLWWFWPSGDKIQVSTVVHV